MSIIRVTTTPIADALVVEVIDSRDPQARYDQMVTLVMRMGSWLSSPQAQLLSGPEWEQHFARYQDQLEQLRRLGDELRPSTLQARPEPLGADPLTAEVLALFADNTAPHPADEAWEDHENEKVTP